MTKGQTWVEWGTFPWRGPQVRWPKSDRKHLCLRAPWRWGLCITRRRRKLQASGDACFPKPFHQHIFRRTFVKALLLLTCWQELTCQLLKWLVDAIPLSWWKCAKYEFLPFTKNLVKSFDFNLTAGPGEKNQNKQTNKPTYLLESSDYSILILPHETKEVKQEDSPQHRKS